MLELSCPYTIDKDQLPDTFMISDHLGGFSQHGKNQVLQKLSDYALMQNQKFVVTYHQILEKEITNQYPGLDILFSPFEQHNRNLVHFLEYRAHPKIDYKNFICSFNGSEHVGRKLLLAILQRYEYFNSEYCSKNILFTVDKLDGHIHDYVGAQDNFYRKFFIADNSDIFFNAINSFGHVQYNHKRNIYNLESKLTQSFLHIVSESMATSYEPFVTEKFLYSVVTRGLFLSYAQPGWHAHLEKYYGFKRYTKLFDYCFDSIRNPVERLIKLMEMISKFNLLTTDDWKDLYQIEQETIEYNYHHYFSQDYLKCLAKYS
jgi:hypothetical protein